jgi:hypothetical protein
MTRPTPSEARQVQKSRAFADPATSRRGCPATRTDFLRSYLHGHSAVSCASSRHSGVKGLLTGSDPDPRLGSAHPLARGPVSGSPGFALQTHRPVRSPWSERRSALHGRAGASTDEHVCHDAAQDCPLASTVADSEGETEQCLDLRRDATHRVAPGVTVMKTARARGGHRCAACADGFASTARWSGVSFSRAS